MLEGKRVIRFEFLLSFIKILKFHSSAIKISFYTCTISFSFSLPVFTHFSGNSPFLVTGMLIWRVRGWLVSAWLRARNLINSHLTPDSTCVLGKFYARSSSPLSRHCSPFSSSNRHPKNWTNTTYFFSLTMTPDADSVLAGFRPATSVFYLDISENVLVPKLIKYIQVNGSVRIIESARVSHFMFA